MSPVEDRRQRIITALQDAERALSAVQVGLRRLLS